MKHADHRHPEANLPSSIKVLFAAVFCVAAPAHAADGPRVLTVCNWPDYIAPDTLAGFEKATGIKVRYEEFETNEELNAKLSAGHSGYDVVVPSSNWAKRQAAAGLLRPIDPALVPNLVNLDPSLLSRLAKLDPGNRYMVPWLWGFNTLGINVGKVKKALGSLPMPADEWDLLFKPEYVSKLKRCGVSIVDSATEVVPAALHYLGRPAYSSEIEDYQGVAKLLAAIRPFVTSFSSADYVDDLAAGRLCLALGFSGDINIARRRAIEARNGQRIQALVPSTGGILFVDAMVIPRDAEHVAEAHAFIDYILQPKVHAALTNAVFYANPNRASLPFVDPAIASDRTVFPSPEELARMAVPDTLSDDARRVMMRVYSRFKAGAKPEPAPAH